MDRSTERLMIYGSVVAGCLVSIIAVGLLEIYTGDWNRAVGFLPLPIAIIFATIVSYFTYQ